MIIIAHFIYYLNSEESGLSFVFIQWKWQENDD